MGNKVKEYLRLGRVFNAEIIALIYIFSYLLAAKLYELQIDVKIIIGLFIVGVFSHVWVCYNNDRLDLSIDKEAAYCAHKPLVSGNISIRAAKTVEFSSLLVFVLLIVFISLQISQVTDETIKIMRNNLHLSAFWTLKLHNPSKHFLFRNKKF